MPLYTRETLSQLLQDAAQKPVQVYLFYGERFLCQQAAGELEKVLLRDGGTCHHIDGHYENVANTLATLRSFSLLPGVQLYRINDTGIFHSQKIAQSLWKKAEKADKNTTPEQAVRALSAFLDAGGLSPHDIDSDLAALSATLWQRRFGFSKPSTDMAWTKTLLDTMRSADTRHLDQEKQDKRAESGKKNSLDMAKALLNTLETGLPQTTVLLLLADEVDKRKKLFKYLQEHYAVLDLRVPAGSNKQAEQAQKSVLRDLAHREVQAAGKSISPQVMEQLFERVGFHPVALVNEVQKLLLSIDERPSITLQDLEAMVGRTRQEALFELTGALGNNETAKTLLLTERLQANGIHPLAIVATVRNFTRRLLIFRTLLEQRSYGYQAGMNFHQFQQTCLPRLQQQEAWKSEFSGHPFALYNQCTTAAGFSLGRLRCWSKTILQAEMRLKGSPLPQNIILQDLMLKLLSRV